MTYTLKDQQGRDHMALFSSSGQLNCICESNFEGNAKLKYNLYVNSASTAGGIRKESSFASL